MRIGTYEGERKLSELVERLYRIGGEDVEQVRAEAERLLIEANADLALEEADLAPHVEEGSLLAVPDVDGAPHTKESESLGEAGATVVLAEARATLGGLEEAFAADIEGLVATEREARDRARSAEVRRLGREDAEIKRRLERVAEAAADRITEAKELKTYTKNAIDHATRDIDELVDLLGRGSSNR